MERASRRTNRICMAAWVVLLMVWLFALALFLVGNFGLFGAERDPLSGVFLIPLGLPWNRFVDIFPEPFWPWLTALVPLVNLALLWSACRFLSSQKA